MAAVARSVRREKKKRASFLPLSCRARMPSAQPLSLAECEQLSKTPAAGQGQGWREREESW